MPEGWQPPACERLNRRTPDSQKYLAASRHSPAGSPTLGDMRYGPNLLEEMLRRTDIVQLVGRRVKLTRKGRVMWGCCPFHKEKSPSFKVENERRTYKCFGCGKGGDAFKWLMETEGLSFPKRWRSWRAKRASNCPNGRRKTRRASRRRNRSTTSIEAGVRILRSAVARAGGRGGARLSEVARAGWRRRRSSSASAMRPSGNSALIEHLKTKNITQRRHDRGGPGAAGRWTSAADARFLLQPA